MKILIILVLLVTACPVFSQFECQGINISWKIVPWDSDTVAVAAQLVKAGYSIDRESNGDSVILNARREKTDSTTRHEIDVTFIKGIIKSYTQTAFFDPFKFEDFHQVLQAFYKAIGEPADETRSNFIVSCIDSSIHIHLSYGSTHDSLTEEFIILSQPAPEK